MTICAVTDAGTGADAVPTSSAPPGSTSSVPTRSRWIGWSRIAATPPASMPITDTSPVVLSYVTACAMLTMSAGAGSRAGVHVDGDDQDPLAALRIVGAGREVRDVIVRRVNGLRSRIARDSKSRRGNDDGSDNRSHRHAFLARSSRGTTGADATPVPSRHPGRAARARRLQTLEFRGVVSCLGRRIADLTADQRNGNTTFTAGTAIP